MRIYVGGVNGCGKTTVLRELSEITKLHYVHATTDFMDFLDISNDYAELRQISTNIRDKKFKQYVSDLISNQDNFLLDSHYTNLVNGERNQIISDWIKAFDAVILITAPADQLLNRIESGEKDRALFLESNSTEQKLVVLQDYQNWENNLFHQYVRKHKLTSIIINNGDGLLKNSISVLKNFLSSVDTRNRSPL
ncbi:MAG: hypothetical protein RLZZ360_145 [Candidatus Parcubacteria bacterium]|jgi:broad-specificity NMP kinase